MIKRMRNFKGLTQKEVADRLGISQSKYSKIENMARVKAFERLEKLSNALDLCPFSVAVFMISFRMGNSIPAESFLKDRGACKKCPYKNTTCPCDRKEY